MAKNNKEEENEQNSEYTQEELNRLRALIIETQKTRQPPLLRVWDSFIEEIVSKHRREERE